MQLHTKQPRLLPGTYSWGARPEAKHRINFAIFKAGEMHPYEPRHYHTTRTTYFCVLSGTVYVEVNNTEILVTQEVALEVSPNEIYRVTRIGDEGCVFVVFGSHNEDDRKIID